MSSGQCAINYEQMKNGDIPILVHLKNDAKDSLIGGPTSGLMYYIKGVGYVAAEILIPTTPTDIALSLIPITGKAATLLVGKLDTTAAKVTSRLSDNAVIGDADLVRTPPTAAQIAELVAEHSKTNTLPLTNAGADAITMQVNPPGTTARVAGDNAAGPDMFITNSATGNQVTTVQVKAVSNIGQFEKQVKDDLGKKLGSQGGSEVIAVQVPIGTNTGQLSGKLTNNFNNYDLTNRSIIVVDTSGKVLISLKPISSFGKK
jgi:hypothetical protein